ncbi:hypothetical protein [Streptosporangium sp. KLBMP 9127]|nr:hypothetical protein [Streptosporangium sp. KLBMP 9127]
MAVLPDGDDYPPGYYVRSGPEPPVGRGVPVWPRAGRRRGPLLTPLLLALSAGANVWLGVLLHREQPPAAAAVSSPKPPPHGGRMASPVTIPPAVAEPMPRAVREKMSARRVMIPRGRPLPARRPPAVGPAGPARGRSVDTSLRLETICDDYDGVIAGACRTALADDGPGLGLSMIPRACHHATLGLADRLWPLPWCHR